MAFNTLLNGYVGGKSSYISKIEAFFDRSCNKYIEPFAGGAAKYFSHYNGEYKEEYINEMDANLASLYKCLAEESLREKVITRILELCERADDEDAKEKFYQYKDKMYSKGTKCSKDLIIGKPNEKMVEVAIATYMVYSQSFNCNAKSYYFKKDKLKYINETKKRLENAVERLKTVRSVTCMDGIEIIYEHKGEKETQMLIDWPYVGMYRRSKSLYFMEMANLYEHIEGAVAMADSQSAIVMCGYRCPIEGVPTIYDAILGEEWHCYKLADAVKHCMVVGKGEHKAEAGEFIWTNRVPERAKYYVSMKDYKENLTWNEYWERIKEACLRGKIEKKYILEYAETYRRIYDNITAEETKNVYDKIYADIDEKYDLQDGDLFDKDFINNIKEQIKAEKRKSKKAIKKECNHG